MAKALHMSVEKCTGCIQCEMACSYAKEGVFNPAHSMIKVFHFHDEARYVPYTCTQCTEAWCMQACPVDAIRIAADGLTKEVVNSACVGCKVCTIACPFGTINFYGHTGKVAKCDMCGGDPACAKACPTGAITYVDADMTGYWKMRTWAARSMSASA